jgi:hypothetical protein
MKVSVLELSEMGYVQDRMFIIFVGFVIFILWVVLVIWLEKRRKP